MKISSCLTTMLLSTSLVNPACRAQSLVDSTRNGTMSVAQVQSRLQTVFGSSISGANSQSLDLYKVRYRSQDERGRNVILSGLLVLPRGGAPKGLVIYNHGTTADRNLSPSRFRGGAQGGENELAALAFASANYAVAMPDYLGLGDHAGAHPYPLAAVNARSAIDLIAPARAVAARHGVTIGPRLFVTGYSEGGAVALWTVRVLEAQHKTMRVTASAPMSGPYDLSGAMRQSFMAPTTNTADFAFQLYFLAYTVDSFHRNNGVRIVNYFKPAMAATINNAFGKNLSDEVIVRRLAIAAALMRANNSVQSVVTPRFWKALQTVDTRDSLIRALKNNDGLNWSPHAPMLLIALSNDRVVTESNTRNALQTMRKRGVGSNVVRATFIQDNRLTHLNALPSTLLLARRFFDGGFAAVQ